MSRRKSGEGLEPFVVVEKPTISNLSQKNWLAVETVIHESKVRPLVPQLKLAGAEGIIEYSLNKIIF